MVIGVGEILGKYFHHAGINFLFRGGQWLPLGHIGIVARELSLSRNDPKLLLSRESPLPQLVPTVVKFALVLVGPFLRHVMRRVSRAWAKIHEEGFIGGDLLGIGDEADRFVHQIFGQVITLFGGLLRFHRMIVRNQFGIILVGLAAEKTVEALEASTERPAIIRTCRRQLISRREVPLAEGIGVVAVLQEDLREEAIFERDVAVAAGITGRAFRNAGHGI